MSKHQTSAAKVAARLPANGGIGSARPGSMGPRGRYRKELPALDSGELPATLMDHPVVAVAEQDQILDIRVPAVAPVHQVMRIGEGHWAVAPGPLASTGARPAAPPGRPGSAAAAPGR